MIMNLSCFNSHHLLDKWIIKKLNFQYQVNSSINIKRSNAKRKSAQTGKEESVYVVDNKIKQTIGGCKRYNQDREMHTFQI